MAAQDIKYNFIRRERFYVRYDEFSINRPENRLIKSTLRFLQKWTRDDRNRQSIAWLLPFFDGVNLSVDYDADFTRCTAGRSMSHYEKALSWCRVFLRGNSFTAFAGNEKAIAILFPMEKVFESYVAAKLRHAIANGDSGVGTQGTVDDGVRARGCEDSAAPAHNVGHVEMRTQDAEYSLFDRPTRAFTLRPDIVLRRGSQTVVMDTKWKLLSENVRNHGISQSDMYQMYAYSKKYHAERIVLIYPETDSVSDKDITFEADDGVRVEVAFIDLLQPHASVARLLAGVRKALMQPDRV